MKRLTFVILLLLAITTRAQDSIRIERLLTMGSKQPAGTCLPLFYAEQLQGTPYVAATLEKNKTEQLVVNIRQLDCTTLIENCIALSLTTQQKSTRYADFCENLKRIRYRQGILDGYASRNHYFSQWIQSNAQMGIVEEITSPNPPFCATQQLRLCFMTQHVGLYPMLKDDQKAQQLIRKYEEEFNGASVHYIPHSQLNGSKNSALGVIQDGDILAIVTKKEGLDVSHLGLAKWGKDGKLHLLNASQIHKKVVLEPMSLYEYMGKHPSQLGIRVIRMR